jgi:hypothetical protein
VGTLNYIKFAADELTRADQIRLIRFRQEKKRNVIQISSLRKAILVFDIVIFQKN